MRKIAVWDIMYAYTHQKASPPIPPPKKKKNADGILMLAFWYDVCRRLDYFVMSERLKKDLCDNVVRTHVMGSDHCPIVLLLALWTWCYRREHSHQCMKRVPSFCEHGVMALWTGGNSFVKIGQLLCELKIITLHHHFFVIGEQELSALCLQDDCFVNRRFLLCEYGGIP